MKKQHQKSLTPKQQIIEWMKEDNIKINDFSINKYYKLIMNWMKKKNKNFSDYQALKNAYSYAYIYLKYKETGDILNGKIKN